MQAEEIGLLLKQDRGQFLEFISAFEYRRSTGQKKREEELAREMVRVLSGMANADGGTVLVGVEPDKSVTGIPHDGDELQTLIQAPQNLLRPQLSPACEKIRLGNLQLLKFEVASSMEIHRIAGGRSFYRIAAETPALPAEQIHSLKEAKRNVFYERQQTLNATWFDLDIDLVTQFVNKLHPGQDPQTVLSQTYHLLDNSRAIPCPNMAALLLFAKDPTRWHPRAGIDFVKYEGNERQHGASLNVVKRMRFEAPLVRLIDEAVGRIKEQIRERTILARSIFSRAPGVSDLCLAGSAGQRGRPPRLFARRRAGGSVDVRRSHLRAQPRLAAAAGHSRTIAPAEKHSLLAQSLDCSGSRRSGISARDGRRRTAHLSGNGNLRPPSARVFRRRIHFHRDPAQRAGVRRGDAALAQPVRQQSSQLRQRRLLAYAYCHGKTFSTTEYERIAEVDRDTAYRDIRLMVKSGIVAPLKPKSRSYRIIEKL